MFGAVVLAMVPLSSSFGQFPGRAEFIMDEVGWEASTDTAPYLFRNVNTADLVSVRARILSQTQNNWSTAGVMVRQPNPVDGLPGQENWVAANSYRPVGSFNRQLNSSNNGVEDEDDNAGTLANTEFVRLDYLGSGMFNAFHGASDGMGGVIWTMHEGGTRTNAAIAAAATVQVGVQGGAFGGAAGSPLVRFDWVEIHTLESGGTVYTDDFEVGAVYPTLPYDLQASNVPAGGIWNGILNPFTNGSGGGAANNGPAIVTNAAIPVTACGEINLSNGMRATCFWNEDETDAWTTANNWDLETVGGGDPNADPNGNTVSVVFGNQGDPAPELGDVVFANANRTVKSLTIDSPFQYVFAGTAQLTLSADEGDALLHVLQGSHQIQIDLALGTDADIEVEAGATLNINAPIDLNGNVLTTTGTVNMNNGSIDAGSAAGAVINAGELIALGGVEGDLTQTGDGSLGVVVGGGAISVSGSAVLDGVLDVSVADGFAPVNGQTYTVLTASSVTDLGLILGGDA
jgi:hypothetical protein